MGYFFDTVGLDFEDAVMDKIGQVSCKTWGRKAFKVSTCSEDHLAGMDCTVLGIPVDVTLAMDRKRFMKKSAVSFTVNGVEISFGVRTGNGRIEFEMPVLVIGFNYPTVVTKCNFGYSVRAIEDRLLEILETGMDEYFALA